RSGPIGGADGAVGGDQMLQHHAARHLDGERRAVIPVTHTTSTGPDGADGNRVRAVIHLDLQVVGSLLGTGLLCAADVDGFLVPHGDIHRAVEAFHDEPTAGLQRVAVMEIFVIAFEAVEVLDVAAGEHDETRGDGGENKLGAHNLPSINLIRSKTPNCFTIPDTVWWGRRFRLPTPACGRIPSRSPREDNGGARTYNRRDRSRPMAKKQKPPPVLADSTLKNVSDY